MQITLTPFSNDEAMPTIVAAEKQKVEDVDFKPVNTDLKKTMVVYNHFNIEAIIAARILKQCYPDFEVVSVSQVIDLDSELYVWIGIDPAELMSKEMVENKDHRVYSSHTPLAVDENGLSPTIVDQVCEDFQVIATAQILRMSVQAAHFYDRAATMADLATVYHDVQESIDFLRGIRPIYIPKVGEPQFSDAVMMDDYMDAVNRVKAQFKKNYRQTPVMDGKRQVAAIYTAFGETDFVIALRLMKLAHANFINHAASINGDLVYSNMPSPASNYHNHEKVVMLN